MSLIKDYLAQKLIYENHPTLHSENCLNSIQTKHHCSICQNLCPHQVFDSEDPNWDLCDDCEICTTACPVRCIQPSSAYSSKLFEMCRQSKEITTISCNEQTDSADIKLSCLAALPWEFLAFLAIESDVHLHCHACEMCEKKALLEQFNDTLHKVSDFLGDVHCQKHIHKITSQKDITSVSYTRREAFTMLFSKSKVAIGNLLPDFEELPPDTILWKKLLLHRIKHTEPPIETTWKIPSFMEDCSACGLCVKTCPVQALHRLPDENNRNRWFMALIPWRCTGCNLCSQICPDKGISFSQNTPIKDAKKPILHSISMTACKRCGQPMPQTKDKKRHEQSQNVDDNTQLCARCRGELRKTIIW